MTPAEITVPFTLGLVSSLHCSQMCGPIVLAYSLRSRNGASSSALGHLAYNAGRILTYTLLGAIAGSLGATMSGLGHLAGIERAASIFAGSAMLLAGLIMSGRVRAQQLIQLGAMPSWLSRASATLLRSPKSTHKLALGLLLGLLPCGLVYAALLPAIASGSGLSGALFMLSFGAGTAPALLGIGLASTSITARLGRYANALATVSILLLGAVILWRGLGFSPDLHTDPHMGHHHGHVS